MALKWIIYLLYLVFDFLSVFACKIYPLCSIQHSMYFVNGMLNRASWITYKSPQIFSLTLLKFCGQSLLDQLFLFSLESRYFNFQFLFCFLLLDIFHSLSGFAFFPCDSKVGVRGVLPYSWICPEENAGGTQRLKREISHWLSCSFALGNTEWQLGSSTESHNSC